jgi:glucuronate isomerase
MQYRIEALPPHKCSLVASDARCIEWCFGKVLLVKHLLVEFLEGQVKSGWIDRDEAIRVAEMWLYNGPAGLYKKAVK